MPNLIIDDGTREYTLTNQFGQEIATIHFRPTDPNIQRRADDFNAAMNELKERIGQNTITESEAEDLMKTAINNVLDSDDADGLFARRSPFTVNENGDFYFEIVVNWILDTVRAAVSDSTKKVEDRMAKYLDDLEDDAGDAATGA